MQTPLKNDILNTLEGELFISSYRNKETGARVYYRSYIKKETASVLEESEAKDNSIELV